jgi:hypothetical protein
MMISPETYIMDHENDSFEELIKERDYLAKEIKKLEKIVYSDEKKDSSWLVKPGPDVRYQMYLEYLAKLCKFISTKYNEEIVWEKKH